MTTPDQTLSARSLARLLSTCLLAAPTVGGAEEASKETATLPRIRVEAPEESEGGYAATRASSATRTDTALRDVPQAITVVTREAMQDQAMHSMADVVRYMPGITMGQGEGNRDQPTIRGNPTTADFFLDGLRDDSQYFRDLYNAERVEALKGPNAMIFGRGGGGGVINRVSKQAQWEPVRQITAQGGSNEHQRITIDAGQGLTDSIAARFNAMYEDSESYRDGVSLERFAVNPTAAFAVGEATLVRLGYEHFSDERTADRGIPSYLGRPVRTDESTFFGDPTLSVSDAQLDVVSASIEHETSGGVLIRNRTRYTDSQKLYQNVFPGAVDPTGTQVSILAYNNSTARESVFNQTDIIWTMETGGIRHTFLTGAELGQQDTENLRLTGYFNGTATSITAPLSSPTISVPVSFRPSANDADNRVKADIASLYVQDQLEFSSQWQAVLGVRYDTFNLEFTDERTGTRLEREDDMISPRAGLIYQPVDPLSIYASYSVSFLPSSGDQFASLSATTQTLEPEEFENYEIGAKWDLDERLALTAAIFQLDRTNTSAPDPNVPGRIVQTGSQRTEGLELGLSGAVTDAWSVFGGYAYQDAQITRRTSDAQPGARIPLTPKHTLSLWNRYDFTAQWGAGLGLRYQDQVYTGIDNSVALPSFTKVDGAVFYTLNDRLSAQVNVENLFGKRYAATAHNNNNITPGSPRAFKLTLVGRF